MANLSSLEPSGLEELVRAGCEGDEKAFTALYDRYQIYAWSVALRATSNRSLAEEAVVDGFAMTFGSLDRLREPMKFPSYLASCVRNEVLMSIRRTKRLVRVDELEDQITDDPTPEGAYDASEESRRAFAAFSRLEDRQQQVIMLVDVEGRTTTEAAAALGLTTNALYQFLFRARKALRLRYIAPALDFDSPQECRDCNDQLAQFVNETASARGVALVEQHLATCPDCQVRLLEAKETCEILNQARGVVPIGIATTLAGRYVLLPSAKRPAHWARGQQRYASAARHAAVLAGAVVVLTGSLASGVLLNDIGTRAEPKSTVAPPTASPTHTPTHTPTTYATPKSSPTKTPTTTIPTTTTPTTTTTPNRPAATFFPAAIPVGQFIPHPLEVTSSMAPTRVGYAVSLFEGSVLSTTITATDPNADATAPLLTESGPLPAGITFSNAGNGTKGTTAARFAGTATSTGTFIVTVTAADGGTADIEVAITVNASPAFTSPTTAVGTVGTPFDFNFVATGFPAPSVSASGVLPPGLRFVVSGTTVSIQGTPVEASSSPYTIAVSATNDVGKAQQVVDITIDP
jgi:RNA polymerase sigma factor (sigma-70 family)